LLIQNFVTEINHYVVCTVNYALHTATLITKDMHLLISLKEL